MAHFGSFRMYEPVVRELLARGHDVHVAVGRSERLGWGKALETLLSEYPRLTWGWLSPPNAVFWAELAKTIRVWADYLRYFHPDYDQAPKLKARAEERVPKRLVALSARPAFRSPGARRRLLAVLRALERALPPVEEVAAELRVRKPDLVIVTPLVYLGSGQFEVLRAALAQGLRTAFAVGSWDHLSSKALIRDMPQRVFVWNEIQKVEAVRLHGVPADRVVVTGAQCYDQWFGRRPVRSREAFCRRVGLPADRPFILYVCSALFRGSPVEAGFVRRWVEQLRESRYPDVRRAAVLIRPHPARLREWEAVDLRAFEHVSLYGSNPVDEASKDDYFESLYYSGAVVGLNTSAFLEGAIVGRPVHTVLLPEFHENQGGVLHFHYLLQVGGGVLRAARSFEEHHAQLAGSLGDPPDRPGEAFVREFIRPHGLDRAATPVFCDAVEDLLREPAPAPVRTPVRYAALRWVMGPVCRALRLIYGAEVIRDDWSRKAEESRQRRERHRRLWEERRAAELEARRERLRLREEARAAKIRAREAKQAARERAVAEKARLRAEKEERKRQRLLVHERAHRAKRTGRAARWLDRLRSGREGSAT